MDLQLFEGIWEHGEKVTNRYRCRLEREEDNNDRLEDGQDNNWEVDKVGNLASKARHRRRIVLKTDRAHNA